MLSEQHQFKKEEIPTLACTCVMCAADIRTLRNATHLIDPEQCKLFLVAQQHHPFDGTWLQGACKQSGTTRCLTGPRLRRYETMWHGHLVCAPVGLHAPALSIDPGMG